MERREFCQIAIATTLASQGALPLLAAERSERKRGKEDKSGRYTATSNIYAEPSAVEPITGHLQTFTPVAKGSMTGPFAATYSLVISSGAGAKSRNAVKGSLDVSFSSNTCRTTEIRQARPQETLKGAVKCAGELHTASQWTLSSSVGGVQDVAFVEKGTWDGKTMVVKSKSWTQERSTSNPLIARWALLPLLASAKHKAKPLVFDMLDDSTLRPDQVISYSGEITIPVAGGKVKLDSYAQTGWGIVPTHYLVDAKGRVQLITMSTVNWALSSLGSGS